MLVENNIVIGTSPKFLKAIDFARNVAVTKSPILLIGEEGTGKKTLCNFIHQNSARKEKPLLCVDCSENPREVENQILGYRDEEGKFHKGVLERANGGIVVFSNIESIDENFQKKLYDILSELVDYDLDVRAIATTSKSLAKYVGNGRFHRALFSYFNNTQIILPSLRDRKDDVRALTEYYCKKFSRELNVPIERINEDAIEKINSMYWSTNYLEFSAVIENAVKGCKNYTIDKSLIELGERESNNQMNDGGSEIFKLMSLKEAEKLLIKKALMHTSENRTQAAKILGVSIRTLRNKINEYRGDGTQYFLNLR
jgi:two-component system response regulator FlrC